MGGEHPEQFPGTCYERSRLHGSRLSVQYHLACLRIENWTACHVFDDNAPALLHCRSTYGHPNVDLIEEIQEWTLKATLHRNLQVACCRVQKLHIAHVSTRNLDCCIENLAKQCRQIVSPIILVLISCSRRIADTVSWRT